MFYKTDHPFTVLPYCISLSVLPFGFSSTLLLSLCLTYKRTWHPGPSKVVILRCYPDIFSVFDSLIKVSSLPQQLSLGFIGLSCSKQSEIWLGNNGCILSAYLFNFFVCLFFLFNFYAEYFMRNAGLIEAQAGIRFAGRNISNLRYADDSTLMVESKEK